MLQTIPLDQIRFTRRNPRHDPGEDLDGLAASLGTQDAPLIVQPPVVEQIGEAEYRILAGERRILAARQAGWQHVACIVRPAMDALQAHTLRLLENLHRRSLHPLDEAAGLKIAWLAANAEAMELEDAASDILGREAASAETLLALQALLGDHGFSPNSPAVTWDNLLSRLGVAFHPDRRKKLLAVLNIAASVQEQVRGLPLTEAALRSLGTLNEETQERLVAAMVADPSLMRKLRRIARIVRDGSYTLEEALAEARGEVLLPGEDDNDEYGSDRDLFLSNSDDVSHAPPPAAPHPGDQTADAVVQLLDAVNQVSLAVNALAGQHLSPPWDELASEAIHLLRAEMEKLAAE